MRPFGRLFERGGEAPEPPVAPTTALEAEPSAIGLRVMKARRRRGWAQTRLAAELGRSDRWVRLLESGELPWVRRLEDGGTPSPHDLRVLTQLAEVLELELADLMRAGDVVAPAALAVAALIEAVTPTPETHASVSAPERPTTPAAGRPLAKTVRSPARLSARRARMLDAMASPLVLIGWATMALGVVAASAAAGVLATPSLRSAPITATSGPHLALHPAVSAVRGPAAPAVPRSGSVSPPTVEADPSTPFDPSIPVPLPVPPPTAAAPVHPGAVLAAATVARAQRATGPVVTLSASVVDFGAVRAGSTVSRTVTLTNTGTAPVHIGLPVVLSGTDLRTTTDCTGRTLAPGQHCSITETFAPGGPMTLSGTVMLTDDTPQGREEFTVRGSGR